VARVVEGDAGKVICKEAEKVKPAAVIVGTRGRSLVRRLVITYNTKPHTRCVIDVLFFFSFAFPKSMILFWILVQRATGERKRVLFPQLQICSCHNRSWKRYITNQSW